MLGALKLREDFDRPHGDNRVGRGIGRGLLSLILALVRGARYLYDGIRGASFRRLGT